MTVTTIDQTTIDHRPQAEAKEHPGVVGRSSDAGGPALPEPADEPPMPVMRARLRSELCI